jgi:amidase
MTTASLLESSPTVPGGISLDEYCSRDAMALAELVRAGQVTSEDLVRTALAAVSLVNPHINAISQLYPDEAVDEARGSLGNGPFLGVPFLVKDLTIQMRGKPCNAGSSFAPAVVAGRDSELMRRFRHAGLVTIGKTTTPEFGAHLVTETRLNGATRNPFDLDHTAGGSSGGSAAAIAAGIVPIAHGNDGFGSIRIPASNCNLFGLKPSRQRTPSGPDRGELSGGRGVEFILSRSVRDSAAMLDATWRPDPGAPHHAPPPVRAYLREIEPSYRKRLRVAVMTRSFSGAPVHQDCYRAVNRTANACEDLGHVVEEAAPALEWERFLSAALATTASNAAAAITMIADQVGRQPGSADLEPATWLFYEAGRTASASDYFKGMEQWAVAQRCLGRFFEQYDILLTPQLSQPPPRVGSCSSFSTMAELWDFFAGDGYSPFSGLFNVTGQPAASIPSGFDATGLPVGSQLVARFGDEATILSLAAALEEHSPWAHRRPPIHAAILNARNCQ